MCKNGTRADTPEPGHPEFEQSASGRAAAAERRTDSHGANGTQASAARGADLNDAPKASAVLGAGLNTGTQASATLGAGLNNGTQASAARGAGLNDAPQASAAFGAGLNNLSLIHI